MVSSLYIYRFLVLIMMLARYGICLVTWTLNVIRKWLVIPMTFVLLLH